MVSRAQAILDEIQAREEKRVSYAPCGYVAWDEGEQRFKMQYPDVECGLCCEECGWNPFIKKARIERRFGQ